MAEPREPRPALDELRALAEAATPGPWTADVMGSEGYDVNAESHRPRLSKRLRRPLVARCGYEDWDTDKANATYIAAVDPATVLHLLAEVDRLTAENERLRPVVDAATEWYEAGSDVTSPDGRAHRATRNLGRAVRAAAEDEQPPDPPQCRYPASECICPEVKARAAGVELLGGEQP